MAMQFDTLDYARRLAQTGVPLAQAEEQAKLLAEVLGKAVVQESKYDARFETQEGKLRSGFDELGCRLGRRIDKLEGQIAELRLEFQARFTAVDGQFALLRWMVGVSMALNIAILVKMFTL